MADPSCARALAVTQCDSLCVNGRVSNYGSLVCAPLLLGDEKLGAISSNLCFGFLGFGSVFSLLISLYYPFKKISSVFDYVLHLFEWNVSSDLTIMAWFGELSPRAKTARS